jgi:hypothetical protein
MQRTWAESFERTINCRAHPLAVLGRPRPDRRVAVDDDCPPRPRTDSLFLTVAMHSQLPRWVKGRQVEPVAGLRLQPVFPRQRTRSRCRPPRS